MSKTYKWIIALLVIILIVAGVWYWQANKNVSIPEGEKQTIVIGASLPLSGNLAFLGEPYKNAMNLALAELSSSGNLKYNYKIVFEDDQFDPAKGVSAFSKLISVDKVDALASFGSPVGSAVSPIAEQNKVVHVNGIASDPAVAIGDYNFVHWTPPYEEVGLLLSEFKKRGIKKVVLFEQNQPGVLAVTNVLREKIKDTDVQIIATEKFNGDVRDFRTSVEKVKKLEADIYLIEVTSPQLEILAKQIKEAGIKTPLTSVEAFMFTDNTDLFKGYWYIAPADVQDWFVAKYKEAYGGEDPKLGSGNGYDVVKLLVETFEKVGDGKVKPASELVKDTLLKTRSFDGAMGNNLSVDSDGLIFTKALVKIVE